MVALAALGGALLASSLVVAARINRLATTRVEPPRLKTAVVLGARVYPDGSPSDALVDRVRVGVALLQAGHVERLLLTGGSPDARPTEAEVMAGIARALGVRAEALVLETHARSTFDNARFCAALLGAEREIVLVTCDFHVARALAQFRAHALTAWPAPSKRVLDTSTRLMVTSREVIGLLRRPWLLRGLRQPEPRLGR